MRYTVLAISIMAILLIGAGCEDMSGPTNRGTGIVPLRMSSDWTGIQNIDNPYNWMGEEHNNCLMWVVDNYYPVDSTDIPVTLTAIVEFYEDSTWNDGWVTEQYIEDAIDSTEYFYNQYLLSVGTEEAEFIEAITEAVSDTTHPVNADGIDTTLIPRLANIESNILNSGLSDSAKTAPLMTVAVAKHSAEFWTRLYYEYRTDKLMNDATTLSKAESTKVKPGPFSILVYGIVKTIRKYVTYDMKTVPVWVGLVGVGCLFGGPPGWTLAAKEIILPAIGASAIKALQDFGYL
jgi:hypothetical protein